MESLFNYVLHSRKSYGYILMTTIESALSY